MCEASYVPPTQSDTQAHPVGATSVYMTQAVTSHIRQAIWAWESCVRPESPVRGSVMYHYTGVVPYAIAKAARPYPQWLVCQKSKYPQWVVCCCFIVSL